MGTVDSFKHSSLPIVDQLIQNGQPAFCVFTYVKSIDCLGCHNRLISQKSLPSWRKELKVNQFYSIN